MSVWLPPLEDRDEWLEWRRGGIGASDVAAIVGLAPQSWNSPYALQHSKLRWTPDPPSTTAQTHGHYAEHAIRAWLLDQHPEFRLDHPQWRVQHDVFEWARFTPDNTIVDRYGEPMAIVEYKVSDFHRWDEIPLHYRCQGQWQLFVSGLHVVVFAVQHGKSFEKYEMTRNEEEIAFLSEAAYQWWQTHIVEQVPVDPDHTVATEETLKRRWLKTEGTVVAAGELRSWVADLRQARNAKSAAEEAERLAWNRIVDAIGGAELVTDDAGTPLLTAKVSTRRSLDSKGLRARYPRAIARFERETQSRTLRLKGEDN